MIGILKQIARRELSLVFKPIQWKIWRYCFVKTAILFVHVENGNLFYALIIEMQTESYLQKVGSEGRFQVFSIVFVAMLWTTTSIVIFLPSYLFITPSFTCNGVTQEENQACPSLQLCTIEQTDTITDHLGLYCDEKYTRNAIQSTQFAGSVIGLLLLSLLADRIGRKVITIVALLICLIGSVLLIIGPHLRIYPLVFVGIFMVGFATYSQTMVTYTYLCEVCSEKWRERSLILVFSFEAVGEMLMYPIIVYIYEWMPIIIYSFVVPTAVLLVLSFLLIEPPEYLYSQSKLEECLQSLNAIARFNGMPELQSLENQPSESRNQQLESGQEGNEGGRTMASLLNCQYLVPLVALSIAYLCSSGYYFVIQYSLDEYGYGFEINMLLIGGLEFISCFLTNFLCPRIKRKPTIIVVFLLAAGLGICDQFVSSQLGDFIIVGLIQLLNTVAMALLYLIAAETFPPEIRSRGIGIPETVSMMGDIGAPFMVTLANDRNVKSVFIAGFISIASAISMFLVKQTKLEKTQIASEGKQKKDDKSTPENANSMETADGLA